MAPLPVNLLCGYLGSGKTTRLNRLLATGGQRIAVMVNDFGAVQIDAALIAGATGDVIRLTNGCVCCSMDGDLFRGFERIFSMRDQIDRLVIEASGVAEPQRLTALARAEPDLACERVVTLVCAASFITRLADPATSRVLEAQVAGADRLIFTRQDSAAPSALALARSTAVALNPRASEAAELSLATLAGPHQPTFTGMPAWAGHFERFGSVVVRLPDAMPREAFISAFAAMPSRLHRSKGFVRFTDDPRLHLFDYAAGELSTLPHSTNEQPVAVMIGPDLRGVDWASLLNGKP